MMIKQKIVLKVDMHCDKCQKRTKKIAASTDGLISMSLELDKNQLEIVGVGVDAVALVNSLRKKVKHTNIVSIDIVKTEAQKKEEEAKKKNEEEEKKKKAEEAAETRMVTWSYIPCHNYPPPPPPGCDMICYDAPSYPNTWFTW